MLRRKLPISTLSLFLLFASACNKPSDTAVTTDIKAKLYSEPLLKAASVDVTAKDGIVTLTGQVPDDAARLAAQHIAATTPGVKTVVDQTTMTPPPPATTAENLAPPPPPEPPARPARPARTPRKSPAPPAPAAAPAPAPVPAQEAAAAPAPLHDPAPEKPSAPAPPPPPPPPQPITVTIPEGTIVTVRTIDAIDSKVNTAGQVFHASLDAPIVVGDRVVVPRGLNVNLKLIDASSAGKLKAAANSPFRSTASPIKAGLIRSPAVTFRKKAAPAANAPLKLSVEAPCSARSSADSPEAAKVRPSAPA
jgi:hypothetical protein